MDWILLSTHFLPTKSVWVLDCLSLEDWKKPVNCI